MAKNKTNQEIFSKIYATGAWGKDPNTKFCSGSGSRRKVASQYVESISEFIKTHPDIKTIVDIGCGDFEVGKSLLNIVNVDGYIGVDVVPAVVEHNANTYGNDKVQFICKDASTDEVPAGDLCTIRQVLQHLSNNDIQNVINNVKGKFKYILVTEHVAKNPHTPNVDKPSNGCCRTGSGVYLDLAPFGLKTEPILNIPMRNEKELVTSLVEA
jgi:hypothetical protein